MSKRHGNGLMENWTEQPVFLQRRRLLFWRTGQICQTYNFLTLVIITILTWSLRTRCSSCSLSLDSVAILSIALWSNPTPVNMCVMAHAPRGLNHQHMSCAHAPQSAKQTLSTTTLNTWEVRIRHVVGTWAKPEPSMQEKNARTTWSASEQNQNHLYKSNTHVPRGRQVSKIRTICTRAIRTYHVVVK